MEKSTTNHHHYNNYLKQLNKTSHKISKPSTTIITRTPPLNHSQQGEQEQGLQNQNQQQQQQQQNQPPVYNINKSDFRQVVQKLTGSPAHERFSTPPPPPTIHSPKPQSSRLQRIRPPPLAQLTTRPPPPPPPPHPLQSTNNGRSLMSPLSPLPPFPTVHAAAESPVSAYMKYFRGSIQTGDFDSNRNSGFSPLWFSSNFVPQQSQQVVLLSPNSTVGSSQYVVPNSPLASGRIPSPRSPYPLLSPSLLFSPTSSQLGFPHYHY